MTDSGFTSVDDYITAQPRAVQKVLRRVRAIVNEVLPEAVEGISYQMPAYKLHGYIVLYFAGWSEHYSLYPAGDLEGTLKEDLASYKVSKGTLRFPLTEPVPACLIKRFVAFRATKTAERKKVKTARKKAAPKLRHVAKRVP